MIAQAFLNLLPKVLGYDRRMLALVNLAFVGDAPQIDRVRQDLVDVSPAEQAAACRCSCTIDTDRNPKALSIELLLEAEHTPRLDIAPKQEAHDLGMIF